MAGKGIFQPGQDRAFSGAIELHALRHSIVSQVGTTSATVAGFAELRAGFGFHVDTRDRDAVRLMFGKRPLGRRDLEGRWTEETGGSLIYSLSPTGDIAILLAPCRSGVHNAPEDYVFLGIGMFSAAKLKLRLKRDLADLVAYSIVTGLDTKPTLGQRARVWWLRQTKPLQVKQEYQPGGWSKLRTLLKLGLLAMFNGAVQRIGVALLVIVLIYLGKDLWLPLFGINPQTVPKQ